jgi:hypothetical protein
VFIGCAAAPEAYPPPIQRVLPDGAAQSPIGHFVSMGDVYADSYIVRDIQDSPQGTGWRWTYARPELRFIVDRAEGWKFAADFSFPGPNFRDTGPVTVSLFINGHLLDRVRYTTPGDKHFEKPVPAAWLRPGDYTSVVAEIDPPWIAPSDNAKLGVVLHRAGFIE